MYDTFDAPVDIRGNRIGITDSEIAAPNGKGIWLLSSSSTLPSNISALNTISANTDFGILLQASQFPSLIISSNNIGSNSAGGLIDALGNEVGISAQLGSTFSSISNNLISSNTEGITLFKNDGGVIVGNFVVLSKGDGIRIGELSDDVIVSGNFIGTDTIETPLGNGGSGISVASNAGAGNAFLSNIFSSNEGLAIDLGQDGHTPNDSNDGDSGPNGLLNFPTIAEQGITFSAGIWSIPFDVDVDAPGNYKFTLYRFETTADGSGKFIPAQEKDITISTVGAGNDFSDTIDVSDTIIFDGEQVVAILTGLLDNGGLPTANTGNSSEFSTPVTVGTGASTPPIVSDVILSGSSWTGAIPYSFSSIVAAGEQFKPIFTSGADTLQIQFSENVTFENNGNELELKGKDDAVVGFSSFSYNPFTFTATWTFAAELASDKYAIHLNDLTITDASGNRLDGDWTNDDNGSSLVNTPDDITDDVAQTFTVGDGTQGSSNNEFRFHFAYLPGDYDGNGVVEHGSEAAAGDGNGDGVIDGSDTNLGTDGNMLPLRGIGGADFGSTTLGIVEDEIVNGFDLTVWEQGFGTGGSGVAGDANGDGNVDGADLLFWQLEFGSFSAWYEGPINPGVGGSIAQILAGMAPQITDLIISGSLSQHAAFAFSTVDGSGAQIATVPVGAADTISITFSELVNISAGDLTLIGLQTGNIPVLAEFAYDSLTMTATWRFESWSLGDQYLISVRDSVTDLEGNLLDGEWVNPQSITTTNALVSTFPSGDGTAGGHFNFIATLLPGDANLDNVVDNADFLIWNSNLFNGINKLFTDADYNGDGLVTITDLNIFSSNYLTNFQSISILADINGDFIVDTADTAVIDANFGMTGATYADGDLNGDGVVSIEDLDLAFLQFGLGLDLVA